MEAAGASIDLPWASGRGRLKAEGSKGPLAPVLAVLLSHLPDTPLQYSKIRENHQENPNHDHQYLLQGFKGQFLWDIYVLV